MKASFKVIFNFFFFVCFFVSCNKENSNPTAEGQVEFYVTQSQLKSLKSELVDTIASNLASIVLTIEDSDGKKIKNVEKVELYNMNGNYISKPLSLTIGTYKLTSFFVLDRNNNIVYAAPIKDSPKAYLVSEPLAITFSVNNDKVVKVVPEVISTIDCTPEEFGYTTFGFNIAKTFDFLLGVFVYNDTVENFALTDANILITSSSQEIYSGKLKTIYNQAGEYIQDSIGVTNKITLPEKYVSYTIKISKPGYKPYEHSYLKEELRKYFSSQDYGPLVIVLEKSFLFDGLVAHYKFNGDVMDYSGYGNHGTYYGGAFGDGRKSEANAVIDLNGFSDYVIIKNRPQLNPINQISLCAWYYPVPFYGNGGNSIINKHDYTNWPSVIQQYSLNFRTKDYNNIDQNVIMFSIGTTLGSFAINTRGDGEAEYIPSDIQYNNWYYIVAVYDGNMMKIYINGELKVWKSVTGNLITQNTDIQIGSILPIARSVYDFTKGKIDEVRIYNRALTQDEIIALYNE